jgi:hypothetical protein
MFARGLCHRHASHGVRAPPIKTVRKAAAAPGELSLLIPSDHSLPDDSLPSPAKRGRCAPSPRSKAAESHSLWAPSSPGGSEMLALLAGAFC